MDDLHHTRVRAKQLQRYANRVKDKIWNGSRQDLIHALSDAAEAGEIARRLYNHIQNVIRNQPTDQD